MRTGITREEFNKIKNTMTYLKDTGDYGFDYPESDDWKQVYPSDGDSKYGTIVYSEKLKLYRNPSFIEFYGGAVVD